MSGYIDNIANDTLLMSGYKYNIWLEGSTEVNFGSGPVFQASVLQYPSSRVEVTAAREL